MNIGLTERHGIADEYARFPPEGVNYQFVGPQASRTDRFITSTAKGVYSYFEDENIDLYEAPIFPILTKKNWIYTPAEYSGTANFSLLGLPLPRFIRLNLVEHLLSKDNFKKLVFKSHAGLQTLYDYGNCKNEKIIDKATVVYPAIQTRSRNITPREKKKILFSGDFFRKGGAHIVDVFYELHSDFPFLELQLCCDSHLHTNNVKLREEYLTKIHKHPNISIGKVTRKEMLEVVLPNTDVFVSPTYMETFGFAILEAMSFGIPVIASNVFAIPEIINNNKDGIMLDIRDEDYIRSLKGYTIESIPTSFHEELNVKLYSALKALILDTELHAQIGENAIAKCKSKFSPSKRAESMLSIYGSI